MVCSINEKSRSPSGGDASDRLSMEASAAGEQRCQPEDYVVSFRGMNTSSSTADRPVTASPGSSSPRRVGSCIAINAMTAVCATLDHAAYAIKLRYAEGSRAASTRKTPSIAYIVQNIGAVVPAVGRGPARK